MREMRRIGTAGPRVWVAALLASLLAVGPATANSEPRQAARAGVAPHRVVRWDRVRPRAVHPWAGPVWHVGLADSPTDVAPPAADMHSANVTYGDRMLYVSAGAGGHKSNPYSFRWQHGATQLLWVLDTNVDGRADHFVAFYNDGTDRLYGAVYRRGARKYVCDRLRAEQYYGRMSVWVPSSCIGSPPRLRFWVHFQYDAQPRNPDSSEALIHDFLPDSQWSTAVFHHWRTKLSVATRQRAVRHGETAYLSGRLARVRDGAPVANRLVTMTAHRRGTGSVRRTTRTDADGRYAFEDVPPSTSHYDVTFSWGHPYLEAHARQVRVDLLRHVHATADRSTASVGDVVQVHGDAAQDASGLRVSLQQQSRGSWRTLQSSTVDVLGSFSFAVPIATPGRHSYRTVVAGDETFSDSPSAPVVVTGEDVRIETVHHGASDVEDLQRPNNEYIVLRNGGPTAVDLRNWTIEGLPGDRIILPAFKLSPRRALRVYSGRGVAGKDRHYGGRVIPMWLESGGTATLYDDSLYGADSRRYP